MENAELKLAEAFVEQTDRHVFLTGKAGTRAPFQPGEAASGGKPRPAGDRRAKHGAADVLDGVDSTLRGLRHSAPHRELVKRILEWRAEQAKSQGDAAPNTVIHQRVAFRIACELPTGERALKRVRGVGKRAIQNYGKDLLDLVATYRREQAIEGPADGVSPGS